MADPVGVRRSVAVAVAAASVFAFAGCGRDYTDTAAPVVIATPGDAGAYHGVELQQPISKPDVMLQDTTGAPFNLAQDTAGELVLVYAGYTHCPDVCPTTMADISVALRALAPQERQRVTVVMFSTDPVRDTPQRMRAFLDQFDPDFIGVVGQESVQIAAVNAMGIDVQAPTVAENGDVLVEHGAQVLAFAPPSDQAGLLWTSGTTASEFREDIQTLLAATPTG